VESSAAPDTRTDAPHTHYGKDGKGESPYAGGSSFLERMAEAVASAGDRRVCGDRVGDHSRWVLINGAIPYIEHTFTHSAR